MGRATNAQYRRCARLVHKGMKLPQALMESKCYTSLSAAKSNGWKLMRRDGSGQAELLAELDRCEQVEFDEAVLSKKEKLQASAALSRGLYDKVQQQIDEDEEIDHKLLDSFNKLGKRDDVLQGHQILAETNPQDKKDAMLSGWMMEAMQENEDSRMKDADVVDI